MAKLKLDYEVVELVHRISHYTAPTNYIRGYSIERNANGPTIVTVTFFADEQFSQHYDEVIDDSPASEQVASVERES